MCFVWKKHICSVFAHSVIDTLQGLHLNEIVLRELVFSCYLVLHSKFLILCFLGL